METYSLIINSKDTTNLISSTNLNFYKYYVNWNAILPKKYNKYSVSFSFKSVVANANTSTFNTCNVAVDFGRNQTINNDMTNSNIIGEIIPYNFGKGSGAITFYFYYSANIGDNLPIMMEYPTNNTITISFSNIDTTEAVDVVNMLNYSIRFNFIPIIE